MTDMPVNGNGAMLAQQAQEQAAASALHQKSLEATAALVQAIYVAARISAAATDTREMDEAAKAALGFAQAIVLLDPTLSTEGVPLAHQVALQQMQGDQALQQAKQRAAAPTPSRTISVKRDGKGQAAQYTTEG